MSSALWAKLLPLAVFCVLGTISVLLWRGEVHHETELILRNTQTAAEQAKIRIEGLMNARISSLELLAERWVEREPPDFSQVRFFAFAETLYNHYPGFTTIYWVDPRGIKSWAYPHEDIERLQGQNLSALLSDSEKKAFDEVAGNHKPALTSSVEIRQGEMGFEVLLPLEYKGHIQGYLNALFQIPKILNISLPEDFFADFIINIEEDGRRVFTSQAQEELTDLPRALSAVREVRFGNRTWQLTVQPALSTYKPSYLNDALFLLFGLGLSAGLALLLFLLLRRMQMYKESRDLAFHEIAERQKIEEALLKNEKKLEMLLKELSDKNLELESFVYTVSHDLKTPIVTIEGFIGALREDFADTLPPDGEKYLQYMSGATRKMEALINDLLELSRIGRMTESKSEFPLGPLVRNSLNILQPQIEARGITIKVQEDLPVVYAERRRLAQVFDNLLANAVKYIGRENPKPVIEIGAGARNGHHLFYVQDNGIGIEERYFDKVFQIFERLPGGKQACDGTGVGLTIVRRIIEHHNGHIWLASEPGEGTTFFFTIDEEKDKNAI